MDSFGSKFQPVPGDRGLIEEVGKQDTAIGIGCTESLDVANHLLVLEVEFYQLALAQERVGTRDIPQSLRILGLRLVSSDSQGDGSEKPQDGKQQGTIPAV